MEIGYQADPAATPAEVTAVIIRALAVIAARRQEARPVSGDGRAASSAIPQLRRPPGIA